MAYFRHNIISFIREILWGGIGTELVGVVYDLRWMVIFSIALILADFWWGYSESMKRLEEAKAMDSAALQDKYKWRKSRAGRRTCNKVVDYTTYLIVGAFLGLAITEPMGICSHVLTAAVGLGLGCGCELASIIGHVAYVKFGVELRFSDVWRWLGRLLVNLIRIKSQDVGEALGETLEQGERVKR